MSKEKTKIELSADGLKNILQETLDGLNEDLEEAQFNIERYKNKIIKTASDVGDNDLAIYGNMFNDSLKIKGSIRDKFLKIANLLKDKSDKEDSGSSKYDNKTVADLASRVLRLQKEKEENNE
jgi:hypothetical protein